MWPYGLMRNHYRLRYEIRYLRSEQIKLMSEENSIFAIINVQSYANTVHCLF
jgi:hypothetical protein